jgi:hypothetical protein
VEPKSGFDEELINIQKSDKSIYLFSADDIVDLRLLMIIIMQ